MARLIINLFADESGATAVEYSLIAALISMAAMVAMTAYGASVGSVLQHISGSIDSAIAPGN